MEGHQEKRPGEGEQSLWAAAGEHTGLGLTWALSVLFFLLGGWWIDERLGTTPLLMIVGAFVGAGAGFYSLYRSVMSSPGSEDSKSPSALDRERDDDEEDASAEGEDEEGGR